MSHIALRIAALLSGDYVAQEIQLHMQYAPEPPFNSGTLGFPVTLFGKEVLLGFSILIS
ncbi:MAG: hypothetical protein JOZ78_03490 [Chroococcidiopsidaceae cyanobacterium CP_BM_ER_R8_30]|nr:hypothetical protein [Chroococcidiopsidaceae cyanobacterium CP_BM_ER_R8_30]